jgi:hypothetical protein
MTESSGRAFAGKSLKLLIKLFFSGFRGSAIAEALAG